MERLLTKWETASKLVPAAEISSQDRSVGVIYYGTTALPMPEAIDLLEEEGVGIDTCRIRAFPFGQEVRDFVDSHDVVFVVEQNRDEQMRKLLINECEFSPQKLVPITYYAGLSISADFIYGEISTYYQENKLPRLTEVKQ